ncbi:class I SAM-dependent methyltransferase [Tomitella cavernea]|uniref:Methyltransferase domain-containing protein n=1 Tax=Tomitella cavernea TaxID=1387982 RepID=A0ABP9C650_9ACTN|nr:methyltransferase domain-containing protein [Tomitella cavernea]
MSHSQRSPGPCSTGAAVYTHGHHESVLRSHTVRTAADSAAYLLPHLRSGMALLDVGSGPGTITADLAEAVAPGRVTAVEATDQAMALTRATCAARGVDVRCLVSDAHRLELPDGAFDVIHAHQVLQHVGDPVQALREMRRVCRPGGVVAVRDADYAGFTWFPRLPELDRWLELYRRAAWANGGEPDAGRRLPAWARAAGFAEVDTSSSTWCFADPESRAWWGGMWAERILRSAIATQLAGAGWATRAELEEISAAWLRWADDPDGVLVVPHVEVLARR